MTTLDILSDLICPWCYIGKVKLNRALEKRPDHPFSVNWRPFQLNPDMPATGMDRRTYLERKFGGQSGAVKVYGEIMQHAENAGVTINIEKITRTPNTLDAHRLIHWSTVEGKQNAVVTALFEAYFQNGEDISDMNVLSSVAENVGMDKNVIQRLLNSDADKDHIKSQDKQAREMGVTGVPCFIVGATHVVNGAQEPEFWDRVITEILEAANQT